MFFSLAAVEVGEHLYWNIAGLTVHGQVLLVTWLVIAIILTITVLGTLKLEQVPKGLQNFVEASFRICCWYCKRSTWRTRISSLGSFRWNSFSYLSSLQTG